jgi:hypothetical protein
MRFCRSAWLLLGGAMLASPAGAQLSALHGAYVFNVAGTGVFVTGSFQADGAGHLTNGLLDSATTNGVQQSVTFTGTYTLGADGRGQLVLNDQLGRALPMAFVAEAGDHGQLIWFDGATDAAGSFDRQDAQPSPQGSFAFLLAGVDGNLCPVALVGRVALDGAGKLSAGSLDYNDCGGVSPSAQAITGAYTPPVAGGRGTLTLSVAGTTFDFAYYAVSSSKLYLIERDFAHFLASGPAARQPGSAFAPSMLSGNYAFWLSGQDAAGALMDIGQLTSDGASSLTGLVDENDYAVPAPALAKPLTGTYALTDAPGGRGTLTLNLPFGATPFVFYMVDASRAYLISSANTQVTSGELRAQTGMPFGIASLGGRYGFGVAGMDAAGVTGGAIDRSGQFSSDGAGGVAGNEDWNAPPISPFSIVLGSGSNCSVDASGHGTLTLASTSGTNGFSFYFVNPNQFLMLGTLDGGQILVGEANKQP